jgi:hypothetical protein
VTKSARLRLAFRRPATQPCEISTASPSVRRRRLRALPPEGAAGVVPRRCGRRRRPAATSFPTGWTRSPQPPAVSYSRGVPERSVAGPPIAGHEAGNSSPHRLASRPPGLPQVDNNIRLRRQTASFAHPAAQPDSNPSRVSTSKAGRERSAAERRRRIHHEGSGQGPSATLPVDHQRQDTAWPPSSRYSGVHRVPSPVSNRQACRHGPAAGDLAGPSISQTSSDGSDRSETITARRWFSGCGFAYCQPAAKPPHGHRPRRVSSPSVCARVRSSGAVRHRAPGSARRVPVHAMVMGIVVLAS